MAGDCYYAPETIPGDTAIAVNPKDPRYGHLIGKHAIRLLPVENQAHLRSWLMSTSILSLAPAC